MYWQVLFLFNTDTVSHSSTRGGRLPVAHHDFVFKTNHFIFHLLFSFKLAIFSLRLFKDMT